MGSQNNEAISHVLCFFGKHHAGFEQIKKKYTQLSWARIKQTHSDIIIHSNAAKEVADIEADSHWTTNDNLGLLISTADCVPLLILDPRLKKIAAVHAGWRGVENRIIPKTIERFLKNSSNTKDLIFVKGPHILKNSFEVQRDVKDLLLRSVQLKNLVNFQDEKSSHQQSLLEEELVNPSKTLDKYFIDLSALVKLQISEYGVPAEHIFSLEIDTKTNSQFHSHRRDQQNAGRNLSFIALSSFSREVLFI